jgi:hypothetical protein
MEIFAFSVSMQHNSPLGAKSLKNLGRETEKDCKSRHAARIVALTHRARYPIERSMK